jgi:hypothetical protein
MVLLGMRAVPKEDTAVSSAEMVLRDPLVLLGQLPAAELPLPPQRSYRGANPPVPTRPLHPAQSGLLAALATCMSFYVRRGGNLPPLAPLYEGPYAALEQGEKVFWLQVGDREGAVSVDRLKLHIGAELVQLTVPPKRGRPPGSAASSTTATFGCQR